MKQIKHFYDAENERDINKDGTELTSKDLSYLPRIKTGLYKPFSKINWHDIQVNPPKNLSNPS